MHLTHFEVEKSLPNDIKTFLIFFYKNHKSLDVAGAEIGLKKGISRQNISLHGLESICYKSSLSVCNLRII